MAGIKRGDTHKEGVAKLLIVLEHLSGIQQVKEGAATARAAHCRSSRHTLVLDVEARGVGTIALALRRLPNSPNVSF